MLLLSLLSLLLLLLLVHFSALARGMYARHGVRGWVTAAIAEKAAVEEDAALAAKEEEERAQALALAAALVSGTNIAVRSTNATSTLSQPYEQYSINIP